MIYCWLCTRLILPTTFAKLTRNSYVVLCFGTGIPHQVGEVLGRRDMYNAIRRLQQKISTVQGLALVSLYLFAQQPDTLYN